MKFVRELFKALFIIGILTILTQVGGIIYLLYKPFGLAIEERAPHRWVHFPLKALLFCGLLGVSSLWIVPRFAAGYGRVPLPRTASEDVPLKPAGLWIVLANRHYVRPALLETITTVARETAQKFPGTKIIYLDANFPFYNGFPLPPHLSHNDGRKLDICFLYQDPATKERSNRAPTFLGYGYAEGPQPGEYDQSRACRDQGYWQYDLTSRLLFRGKRSPFTFDELANKALIQIIARQESVGKIFIEPHLKARLNLQNLDKIRFHGCQAVRHDDHIHLEISE